MQQVTPSEPAAARSIYYFHFYGLTIEVASESEDLLEEVRRHLADFLVPEGEPQVRLELHIAMPPYDGLPAVPASVFTPRNVSFKNGRTTYIDYFGQALAIFDRDRSHCGVYGTSIELLQEIA